MTNDLGLPDTIDPDFCPWCTSVHRDGSCPAIVLMALVERAAMERAERARIDPPQDRRLTWASWLATRYPELADLDVPTDDDELPEPF